MTYKEDKDLSICATKKAAMPLVVENELTAPLKCNILKEDFDSFKEAIATTINTNIELLKELPVPKNFSIEQVITFFKSEIKSNLQKDCFFEKTVEVCKYANSMFESMEKYFKNVFGLHTSTKERHCSDIFEVSKLFLNSDLSDVFLKAISNSFLIENDFIDLYDKRIRKEHATLIAFRNNRTKFERLCNEHNYWVHDFTAKLNSISRNRTKLIWYVDINNSNTVEELFKDKFIKTEVLDNTVLCQLIQALEQNTSELELLFTRDVNLPCLPRINVDDSVRTITGLMDILNR